MAFLKRIFVFGLVNLLIIVTISTILSLTGLGRFVTKEGIDYTTLMGFCLVWGMGGAFISLMLSRIMAKMLMGVQVIPPNTTDATARDLMVRVHSFAKAAGIDVMPEVGIYRSPELNAFATGPTKNRALVAVSSGLLERMERDELDGVLGHEVAHIANGDMVTMTLIQGVVNAFVMFFARIIAYGIALSGFGRNSDSEESAPSPFLIFGITIVLEIVFSLLGMFVVAYFSRQREFRADAGGAKYAGREKMIRALQKLRSTVDIQNPNEPQSLATLKISTKPGGFLALLSTHPPLEERIQRLARGI